ncbi:MAG: MATE family efflux transporter [Merdibacter sp.]
MNHNLTNGPIIRTMLRFALPMILGDLLQQCYNIADTLIVGRVLGADALAAVGSAFSLMTFLTSILLGLAMGSGTVFSIRFGQKKTDALKECVLASFVLLGSVTLILNVLVYLGIDWIIQILQIPQSLVKMMHDYLIVIFAGLAAIFLYNFFAALLRSLGNSIIPLVFLAVSAVLNIVLDLWFVASFTAAWPAPQKRPSSPNTSPASASPVHRSALSATVSPRRRTDRLRLSRIREITGFSALTCLQQSIMNLGILAVQGLVNSFGPAIMAAFAAGVKIDAFAYLPVQDFGNAFSIFIAQNYGAGRHQRIRKGIRAAMLTTAVFGALISAGVIVFAQPLMMMFIDGAQTAIITEGVSYLRIEGAFYPLIGLLFLFYGIYRALGRPGMSLLLTIASLGSRVFLAYALSSLPGIGVTGIWWSVPIGWLLADLLGLACWPLLKDKLRQA